MTDPNTTPNDDPIPYAEALRELHTIVQDIENDNVDLDQLSSKVERAAHLIQTCRTRIQHTELRIRQVLQDLNDSTTPDP